MKRKASKAMQRSISVFRQVIQEVLPGHRIDELAADEKVKAREFPNSSRIYLLMLGQFLHLFSLNELVDVSNVFDSELRGIRGIVPAKRNTFSHANRTRNPEVAERFFWFVHDMLTKSDPKFAAGRKRGALAKFRHGADCSYTRFVAFVRAIVWLKKDLLSVLRSYGIAPGRNMGESGVRMPYLTGFEKHFLKSAG